MQTDAPPIETADNAGDGLDPAGRRAARRKWMRQYLRSSVQDRLAGLEAMALAVPASESAESAEEPTP